MNEKGLKELLQRTSTGDMYIDFPEMYRDNKEREGIIEYD